MICAGIDAGSRTIKIVLMEADTLRVITKAVTDQGVEQDKLTSRLFQKLLKNSGASRQDVGRIVATGYGRNAVSIADTTITEITCHAVGVCHFVPDAMTV
ncbi:MAG: 2-hydroxyglutaryl-CoA dehydratase, partial [Planctomycetota bacterium]|nr:2-hydroxyglutaryl-CoA dehydratase [Planctomycetota bacterium]